MSAPLVLPLTVKHCGTGVFLVDALGTPVCELTFAGERGDKDAVGTILAEGLRLALEPPDHKLALVMYLALRRARRFIAAPTSGVDRKLVLAEADEALEAAQSLMLGVGGTGEGIPEGREARVATFGVQAGSHNGDIALPNAEEGADVPGADQVKGPPAHSPAARVANRASVSTSAALKRGPSPVAPACFYCCGDFQSMCLHSRERCAICWWRIAPCDHDSEVDNLRRADCPRCLRDLLAQPLMLNEPLSRVVPGPLPATLPTLDEVHAVEGGAPAWCVACESFGCREEGRQA